LEEAIGRWFVVWHVVHAYDRIEKPASAPKRFKVSSTSGLGRPVKMAKRKRWLRLSTCRARDPSLTQDQAVRAIAEKELLEILHHSPKGTLTPAPAMMR